MEDATFQTQTTKRQRTNQLALRPDIDTAWAAFHSSPDRDAMYDWNDAQPISIRLRFNGGKD